jgi:hypothetical protein
MSTAHSAIVVLYDPATGEIVHGHYCEADSSADLPGKEALEKAAMEAARHHQKKGGFDLSKAHLLHVDPASFQMTRKYRVDPKLKKLAEK